MSVRRRPINRMVGGRARWIGAATVALGLAAAPAASATTASAKFATYGEHAFVVPAGVHSVKVALTGGSGGNAYSVFSEYVMPGGPGGVAVATVAVSPGQVLFANVAGNGVSGWAGQGGLGAPGGGNAGQRNGAGGGGGASVLRRCSTNAASPRYCGSAKVLSSRLLVAGGGGGAGGDSDTPSQSGGAGGAAGHAGSIGLADYTGDAPGQGGQPGTHSAGGAGGAISQAGAPSTSGGLGFGGNGGGTLTGGGGGGGGGLYGGGGGGGGEYWDGHGSGGGGGGGSSGAPTGVLGLSGLSTSVAPAGSLPSARFVWILPAPTVVAGSVSGLSTTAATLHGVVNPNGSPVSDCHFVLTTQAPSTRSLPCREQVGGGSTPVGVSAQATGLKRDTVYGVRLVATNTQGTRASTLVSFRTKAS